MCGIIGYVGSDEVVPVLLDGLRRLEYRGYDSAGIAVLGADEIGILRAAGKLGNLEQKAYHEPLHGTVGIGHTRWATHGAPTEANAHPKTDIDGQVAVVHNCILENYGALRREILDAGVGLATVHYTTIFMDPDWVGYGVFDYSRDFNTGAIGLFYDNGQTTQREGEWGANGAWAWGLSLRGFTGSRASAVPGAAQATSNRTHKPARNIRGSPWVQQPDMIALSKSTRYPRRCNRAKAGLLRQTLDATEARRIP